MAQPVLPSSQNQQVVVEFLSSPHSYSGVASVERIDTHAAMVFLAGDRAYKLKRAVQLPYLDFSTPEKRRAMLEAELQLNRRTAPDLYLNVQAVRRTGDGTYSFAAGEPVDWVLVMRRFETQDLLENVAVRGELSPAILRQIADAIAAFHDAEIPIRTVMGSGRVHAVIEGNRAAMAALPDGILPTEPAALLHARTSAGFCQLRALLDRRGEEGLVRHCHGDLHLRNICLWRGRPVLFDCLEFDPELATSDTLYDLAFLLMDLVVHGRRDAANLVLNRYCDRLGEAAGLAAMPLFLSMRACVRAHVAALAAALQPNEPTRKTKVEEGRRYLAAALDFLNPGEPVLVAVGGLSGSGKSTLAGGLAPHIGNAAGARWLRSDVIRKRLAGVAPEERLPATAYSSHASKAVYAAMLEEADTLLTGGVSVVLDAVFADPAERKAAQRLARETKTPCVRVWLDAPKSVLVERVRSRVGDPSDADEAVVEKQADYPVGDLSDWLRLDGADAPTEVLEQVFKHSDPGIFASVTGDWLT